MTHSTDATQQMFAELEQLFESFDELKTTAELHKEELLTVLADSEELRARGLKPDTGLFEATSIRLRYDIALANFRKTLSKLEIIQNKIDTNEAYQHYLKRNDSKPSLE